MHDPTLLVAPSVALLMTIWLLSVCTPRHALRVARVRAVSSTANRPASEE